MEETTHLKNEIDRLNKIINILVDQIGMLKSENKGFKEIIKINELQTTVTRPDNSRKEIETTVTRSDNGKKEVETTVTRPDNGQKEIETSVAQSGNGKKEIETSVAESDNGRKEIETSVAKSDNTGNEIKTTVAQNGNIHLELNRANKLKLARTLETYFKNNIKRKSLEGLAAELLLLHNNGHANYMELRKEAGLSVPGFAKHGPMLQSKGLIKRESFQKYVLTPHSKDIIIKTFSV